MAKRKSFDLDCAIAMYQKDNLSTAEIGIIFKVHLQTVINHFKEAGIPLRPRGQTPSLIDPEKIKYDYNINKMSTSEIADKYSISTSLVRKKLVKCGIKLKKFGGSSRAIKIDRNKLKELYCDKLMTMKSCAKYFEVSDSVIRRNLNEMGIEIRQSTRNSLMNISDSEIIDLYWNQKLSISETANKLGHSTNFVRSRLERIGTGTRSWSEGSRLWRKSDDISNDQLIYLYDVCGWSCEKISAYFNKSSQFVRQRFLSINKKRRNNTGKYNGSWKGDITNIRNAVRSCAASLQWRKDAFDRQRYCSEISGLSIRELNCHYIYPFHVILQSSITKHKPLSDEYRSLAIIHDPRFYDADNSLVVSEEEHDTIEDSFSYAHPWWKIWKAYPDFAINRSGLVENDFAVFENDGMIKPINYKIMYSKTKEIKKIIRYEHYLGTVHCPALILVAKIGNIIIGVAVFGKGANKHIDRDTWELTRLCIPFYVIKPFACNFITECCDYIRYYHQDIKNLISFADSSVGHNGGIYRIAGWNKAGKTSKSYAYFDPTTLQLKHKSLCRRIRGINKTERELADERGLIKIPLGHKHRYTLKL